MLNVKQGSDEYQLLKYWSDSTRESNQVYQLRGGRSTTKPCSDGLFYFNKHLISVFHNVNNFNIYFYSIECLQSSSNHLDINFGAVVLPPGGTSTATFTFYPRETIAYRDVITFLINGLSKREVEIKGEGTEMRVSVW